MHLAALRARWVRRAGARVKKSISTSSYLRTSLPSKYLDVKLTAAADTTALAAPCEQRAV
jgi:hypothetical protein